MHDDKRLFEDAREALKENKSHEEVALLSGEIIRDHDNFSWGFFFEMIEEMSTLKSTLEIKYGK